MKTLFLAVLFVVPSFAFAKASPVTISSATLDRQNQIQVVFSYQGCPLEEIGAELEWLGCAESYPAQCQARLHVSTSGECAMSLRGVYLIDANKFNPASYRGASLTIFGSGTDSSKTVRLP